MALNLNRNVKKPMDNGEEFFNLQTLRSISHDIERFRDHGIDNDADWQASLDAIIGFQLADGSFALISEPIPSDERVYFVKRPSYACCQALIRAVNAGKASETSLASLKRALAFCAKTHLAGHGFDDLAQQIEDVTAFGRNGCAQFLETHSDLCREFTEMINEILDSYRTKLDDGTARDAFGGLIASDLMRALDSFGRESRIEIFVYGTLMTDMPNARFIEHCPYLGEASVTGYELYDLGAFPAMVKCSGLMHGQVTGEIRFVDADTLDELNRLEGEGHLYRLEHMLGWSLSSNGPMLFNAYIYNGDIDPTALIPNALKPYSRYARMRDGLVWYAAYGSNLSHERMMAYITGGRCRFNERSYPGCDDKTPPLATCDITIPYELYFGNSSSSWGGCGAAFLDLNRKGKTYGRAYLITREQFEQIHDMEGRSASWYGEEVELGSMGGIPVRTFTNATRREPNAPSPAYLEVMRSGLFEGKLDLPEEEIDLYLEETARR